MGDTKSVEEIEILKQKIEELEKENARLKIFESNSHAFWGQISHEMRTPLGVIIGVSDNLKSEGMEPEVATVEAEKLDGCSEELMRLADNVVDYSAIAKNDIAFYKEEFSLKDFMHRLAAELHVYAKKKRVHLYMHVLNVTDEYLIEDQYKIYKVVRCFCEHAIDCTPSQGKVEIILRQATSTVDKVFLRFHVKSLGMKLYQSLVYDYEFLNEGMFNNNYFEGNGIELLVCDTLLKKMGGKINFEGIEDQYSQMTLDFEFNKSSYSGYISEKANPLNNDRILIVGDSKEWCKKYVDMLSELPVTCEVALEYDQALDMIGQAEDEERPYCICVADWYSKNIPIEDFVAEVRSTFGNSIAIIANAYDAINRLDEAEEIGVDTVIEDAWYRSAVFDTLQKYKNGEFSLSEEDVLDKRKLDFEGRRVLVAEDIPLNLEMVVKMLSKVNVSVIGVSNGMEAVTVFRRKPEGYFNCIFLDINMPIMDGYEAAREIRSSGRADAKEIPIYALTANAFSSDIKEALDAGMDGHMAKPIEKEVLYDTLETIFSDIEDDQFLNLKRQTEELLQMNDELQSKAEHDQLTGLLNRHGFERKIEPLMYSEKSIGLILVDLDKFKGINDTYGHEVGDKVLQKLATTLRAKFRTTDDIIRFGGDEFAVLLNNVKGDHDFVVRNIEAVNKILQNPEDGLPAFSISTGVAFSEDGYTDELYNHADQALYNVKENGRCGCCIFGEEGSYSTSEEAVNTEWSFSNDEVYFVNCDNGRLVAEKQIYTDLLMQNNNDVGTISGFYEDGLPVYSVSELVLQSLGYTYDEFIKETGGHYEMLVFKEDVVTLYEDLECEKIVSKKIRFNHKNNKVVWMNVININRYATDGRKMWISSVRAIDDSMVGAMCDMDYAVVGLIYCDQNQIIFEKGIENLAGYQLEKGKRYDYESMLWFSINKNILPEERENVFRRARIDFVMRKLKTHKIYEFVTRHITEEGKETILRYKFRYLSGQRDIILCTQEYVDN